MKQRNAQEDLAFFNTNRFKGSKVKEIAEYWIGRCEQLELLLTNELTKDGNCQIVINNDYNTNR